MGLDAAGVVWHHRGAVMRQPYSAHRTIDGPGDYARMLAEIEQLIEMSVRRTREEDELLEHLMELAENYRRRQADRSKTAPAERALNPD